MFWFCFFYPCSNDDEQIFKAINAENDDVKKSPYQKTTTDDSKEQVTTNSPSFLYELWFVLEIFW